MKDSSKQGSLQHTSETSCSFVFLSRSLLLSSYFHIHIPSTHLFRGIVCVRNTFPKPLEPATATTTYALDRIMPRTALGTLMARSTCTVTGWATDPGTFEEERWDLGGEPSRRVDDADARGCWVSMGSVARWSFCGTRRGGWQCEIKVTNCEIFCIFLDRIPLGDQTDLGPFVSLSNRRKRR